MRNTEECFKLLEEELDDSPGPVIDATASDRKTTIRRTGEGIQ